MAEELDRDNKRVNTQLNPTDDSIKNKNNIDNNIELTDAESENKNEDKSKIGASKNSDNANDQFNNMKEELHSKIVDEFKKLKEETGYTNEELFQILMDADENKAFSEEEEEEEEAPDDKEDDYEEQDYGSPEYWENRYRICPEAFDWYQKWDAINNELNQLFNGDELVLNIGCGNSEMSADMQKTTFQTVVNIDISGVVIEQMIEKYKSNKDLLWFEMDCKNLTFEDEFFDIVFDKGTFDAILCGENSIKNIYMSMSEIWRVLKYGGLFIEITYGQPSHRLDLFKNTGLSWKLYEPLTISSDNNDNDQEDNTDSERNHYIYIFQKLLNYSDDAEEENNDDENKDDKNNEINANDNESNIENTNSNENNDDILENGIEDSHEDKINENKE